MKLSVKIPCRQATLSLHIACGIFNDLHTLVSGPAAIVSDESVSLLWAGRLSQQFRRKLPLFTVPDGEKSKSRKTVFALYDKLSRYGFGRDMTIIALGGGVVTDLTAFVASTYARGVKLILVPSSLLAMVDAAIGGKTAINLPKRKNYAGSFYLPETTVIDPLLLTTQPENSFKEGVVEMIKHGAVADYGYFCRLEKNIDNLLTKNIATLTEDIKASCKIKLKLVAQDMYERGTRSLLNLGHTIGHAVEAAGDYLISHGTATAFGMIAEARMAKIKPGDISRLKNLFLKMRLPFEPIRNISDNKILKCLSGDKKAIMGKPRFVLFEKLGKCSFPASFRDTEIKRALELTKNDLC